MVSQQILVRLLVYCSDADKSLSFVGANLRSFFTKSAFFIIKYRLFSCFY